MKKKKFVLNNDKIKYALFFAVLIFINIPLTFYETLKENVNNFDVLKNVLSYGLESYYTKEIDEDRLNIQQTIIKAAGYVFMQSLPVVEGVSTQNTDIPQAETDAQLLLNTQYHNGEPLVLIYHTHTTESYFSETNPTVYRSSDPASNLISAGHLTAKILYEEYGIQVLYLTETFDQPYDTAYEKSLTAVEKAIADYPSIQYAFDIHRDGLGYSEDNMNIYKADINGNAAAKIMMVIGSTADNYQNNLSFANQIQSKMEETYPGLYRKILEKPYKYNQYAAPTSILFELGSNLSTPQEAKTSAVYLGRVLGELLSGN